MSEKRVRFARPPVVEVVCGVQFHTQALRLQSPHFGLYWNRVREEFPNASDNAPLPPVIEAEGGSISLPFQFEGLPPIRRIWLTSADGRALIQVQEDRFIYNWKRNSNTEDYPSYDNIVVDFMRHLAGFEKFISDENLGNLEFRQFEMTYVNHIDVEKDFAPLFGDVLVDHVRFSDSDNFLPVPEKFNWSTSYLLPNSEGRLHIVARTATRKSDQARILRVDMTARGFPAENIAQDRQRWFDLAHEWITHGFAACTSRKLHEKWGRLS